MTNNQSQKFTIVSVVAVLVRIVLALFFLFVGYWKAFGPVEMLAEHGAWVAGFPVWFARGVGLTEIVCAMFLLAPARLGGGRYYPLVIIGAFGLLVNQMAALAAHAMRAEFSMIMQNIILMSLLLVAVTVIRKRQENTSNKKPMIL